ncbi:MAG: hypothetical protein M3198_14080 [Actinomycetota bacterium]|nr:hypothetical protein [Actinomycetota bacterium]
MSGREFIELAAAQYAEVNDTHFGYAGEAVCMLASVGTTEEDCLDAGEPYWGYWRSDGSGWERSDLGFTETQVTDGDIEGWSWAPGQEEPPHPSFRAVCGYTPRNETGPDEEEEGPPEEEDDPRPDPEDKSPSDAPVDDEADGGEEGDSSGPSRPGRDPGKPSKFPTPLPSAEAEPDERRIDAAPDMSELTDAPTPETVANELPPSATTAGTDPEDFPLAGALALVATFAMAGVAVLLMRKRVPAKPKD